MSSHGVQKNQADTICAVATPPGVGGVGIVRISGPLSGSIAEQVLDVPLHPRQATFAHFVDEAGHSIDTGIALFFARPSSFTGEDVLELQGHGGPQVLHMMMSRVLALGARPARPGEFSERAFVNNKIDLAQAEAIADLIEAGTAAAARAAQRSLEGVLSGQVNKLQQELIDIRVFVEAALDFPEEEIDFLTDSDVLERMARVDNHVLALLDKAHQGRLLRDGIHIAIAGRPNAGKSSLLNALAGRESAIVTEVPGTTRDVLREYISLDGLPAHIADTAGIRESKDRVEAEGIRRARAALASADVALLVIDSSQELAPQQALRAEVPAGIACIEIYNKTDLARAEVGDRGGMPVVHLCAITGQGLGQLVGLIKEIIGAEKISESSFSARTRHIDALKRCRRHITSGRQQLQQDNAPETLAEELRLAHKALGEITGEFLPDDLLGAIFASFCIGK